MDEEEEDDIPMRVPVPSPIVKGLSIYNKGVISRRGATHLEKGAVVPT